MEDICQLSSTLLVGDKLFKAHEKQSWCYYSYCCWSTDLTVKACGGLVLYWTRHNRLRRQRTDISTELSKNQLTASREVMHWCTCVWTVKIWKDNEISDCESLNWTGQNASIRQKGAVTSTSTSSVTKAREWPRESWNSSIAFLFKSFYASSACLQLTLILVMKS